jgi:hypothetical protein
MKCSLDSTPSSPHKGIACLRWYADQQDSRYTQVLCDGHADPRFWTPVKAEEKPMSRGFVGKHGYASRKGSKKKLAKKPALKAVVPPGVEGFLYREI